MATLTIVTPVMPQEVTPTMRFDRDEELLEGLRHAEPAAAERLVTTYGNRAYRLAIGITGNSEDAEEVVQDALWTVVRKIALFHGESSLGTWLYRIVANAAYQKRRSLSRRRADISLDNALPAFREDGRHATPIADWPKTASDPSRDTELRLMLNAALEDLPAEYRAPFVLHDVEGLSYAEIGDALSLDVSVAKSRVHRARLSARRRLATHMETGTSAATVSRTGNERS